MIKLFKIFNKLSAYHYRRGFIFLEHIYTSE